MLVKILFSVCLINLFCINLFSQSVGDYRSVTNGNWKSLSSWEYYNGSGWVTPSGTSPQGYPGQYTGTGAVLIQAGHTITINSSITTLSFGTLTITGRLTLTGDNSSGGMDFYLTTQSIVVTPSLGFIEFNSKLNLRLPVNASLQVSTAGLDVASGCSANQVIYIGTAAYSKCNGGGSLPDFDDLMAGGGTLNPIANSNSPVCQNSTINLLGSYSGVSGTTTSGGATNGVNYSWSVQAPDASITTSSLQNYSLTGTQTGNYSATLTCTTYFGTTLYTNAKTITVTVNALPSTPIVGTITQSTCGVATGSVVLSGLPASGTVSQTAPSVTSYAITGTTMTISGLAAGTYQFLVSNGTCTSSSTGNVVLNSPVTKTWNGTWSPAGAPTSNDIVVINANYNTSSNGDLNACSLIINAGKNLTITAGKFVIVQNDLTVDGILDVFDKGSLVMVNDLGTVTNNGTTNVRRFTTPFKQYDYTYWSSPVVSTTIAVTFLGWNINNSYEYVPANFFDSNSDGLDDDGNDWSFASTMVPGHGYIIMVPKPTTGPGTNNPNQVVFNGKVNNGVQKITGVIPDSSYLLGNPYPSALDAEAFLDYNAGVLDGTLYFWTHNTAIQLTSDITNGTAGSGLYAFTSDDYASYNAVGGVGVGSGSMAISGGDIPTGKIASGQGFFASSNVILSGANEIVFNNAMRLSPGGATLDNSQFFKTKNSKVKTTNGVEKHRVWLNLTNTQGAFKQTLVGYVTGATNDIDSRFDGESYDGNEFIDFYSVNQDKNLVIQGRALPFDENDEVPLGYTTVIDGIFSINIGQVDGLLSNQEVFLEDKLTNTEFDLKTGNYTFNTRVGIFNNRFVLKYKPSAKALQTLTTENFDAKRNKVLVSVKNKQIKINSFEETIKKVLVYDVLGKLIYQKTDLSSDELLITDLASSHQALVVKTELKNGANVIDKIIF